MLKWERVHPEPDRFDFEPADRFVELGPAPRDVRGRPRAAVAPADAGLGLRRGGREELDRETALARLKSHIQAVAGRYKGRIGGWDVVNEALDEDGTLRRTPWLEAIGEDYVAKAFEFAREADPAGRALLQRLQPLEAGQARRGDPPRPGAQGEGPARRRHRRAGPLGHRRPAARRDRRGARRRCARRASGRSSPSSTSTSCPATPTCGGPTSRRRRRSGRPRTSTRTACRPRCRRSSPAATRTSSGSS